MARQQKPQTSRTTTSRPASKKAAATTPAQPTPSTDPTADAVAILLADPTDQAGVSGVLQPLTPARRRDLLAAVPAALLAGGIGDGLGNAVTTLTAAQQALADQGRTPARVPVSPDAIGVALARFVAGWNRTVDPDQHPVAHDSPLGRFLAAAAAVDADQPDDDGARFDALAIVRRVVGGRAVSTGGPRSSVDRGADPTAALVGVALVTSNGGQVVLGSDGWAARTPDGQDAGVHRSPSAAANAADGRPGASLNGWRDLRTADGRTADAIRQGAAG